MRIAVVYLAEFPPAKGGSGADRRVRDIVRGLASQGNEVEMWVPRRNTGASLLDQGDYRIRYCGPTIAKAGRLRARLGYWREVLTLAKSGGFDWVLLYSVRIDAFLPALLMRSRGIKIASEFCDLRSSGIERTSVSSWLTWLSLKADEILMPRVSDLNIAISRYLVDHVTRHSPRSATLRLPVLVDSDLFKPSPAAAEAANLRWGIPSQAPVFAYVGGLWKQEGVRFLVEAFTRLAKRHPEARLIIAGRLDKAASHDDVEAMAQASGLGNRIITPGWVSTEDVVSIYSRADVLVLPQARDLFAVAALPTKLAEYSNVGKAIIASDVGDVGQYFVSGRDALLVECENVDQLEAAMEKLAGDKQLRAQLSEGATKVARANFDYREAGNRIAAKMISVSSGQTSGQAQDITP